VFFINVLLSMVPDRVVRGTADVFTEFYKVYLPKVFRYISYKVSDVHLAEDLTSAVFEKALTRFKTYDEKKAAFATWVFRIARNTVIDHFRASARNKTVTLEDMTAEPPAEGTPEEAVLEKERNAALRRCLDALTEREREIVQLKFAGEMNNRQIAGLVGLSDANVGVILYRAVRKMRAEYAGSADA
jgi:RNA polymerase sigma factor (sigma-70 family)